MKRLRSILLGILGLCLLISLLLIMWPEGPLDLSKDEEPFRSMVLPPKSAIGLSYMDGGSAAMRLIDNKGMEYYITFPINYDGILDSYPQAYYGEINDSKMILLKDPSRAKVVVSRLLRDFGKEDSYGSVKFVRYALTHRIIPFKIRHFFN